MPAPYKDDRIDVPIERDAKKKYRRHALQAYGLKLANWIQLLMKKDFDSHQ